MDRSTLAVADVFRRYGDTYRDRAGPSLSMTHRRVMTAIEPCRTAALGGHVEQCDRCAHTRIWYNSCRHRHCPTCQSLARAAWIEDRTADLLDTEYVHVVFTVPQAIAEIAAQNPSVVYGILFRAAAETLRTIAADPKHVGAAIGFFAVLHTWGQTLVHHPHLHGVVPGGGLDDVGRYTHRVAISNHRLIDIDDDHVRFRYTDDRADPSQTQQTMTLGATEFIRRVLLHVLPPGFHRIRSDGLFGNRHRREHLAQCRHLLGTAARLKRVGPTTIPTDYRDRDEALTGCSLRVCPRCHDGQMLVVERLVGVPDRPRILDTS